MKIDIRLSPSKMNLLYECPRCFWLANKKILARAEGISAGIPKGMDRTLKEYYDRFAGVLPPDIAGKVPGHLCPDREWLRQRRNWRTGVRYANEALGVEVVGALDECLVNGQEYMPLDYKTKANEPEDSGAQYYQLQQDFYMLALKHEGFKINGKAYLVYYWPVAVQASTKSEATFDMTCLVNYRFGSKVFELDCSEKRALAVIEQSVKVLRGDMPAPGPECKYCQYAADYRRQCPDGNLAFAQ